MPDQPNLPQPPTFPDQQDIPPMPVMAAPPTPTPPPSNNDVLDIPPMIVAGSSSPKGRSGKIIATILGILLLVGAVAAGVILVGQKQLFQQKAALAEPCKACVGTQCQTIASPPNCSPSLNECSSNSKCATSKCDKEGQCDCSGNKNYRWYTDPVSKLCALKLDASCVQECTAPPPPPPPSCGVGLYCNKKDPPTGSSPCSNQYGITYCCPAGQYIQGNACVSSSGGGGGDWPPNGTSCKHTGGTTSTIGGCVTYFCPSGCGSDNKCGENDSGVYWNFSNSCSDSLLGNSCGQIDTVDVNKGYCIASGYKESKIQCSGCVNPPTATPPPPGETAQCLNVKAYDTSWNQLSQAQLNALKSGDKVRFTVSGSPADKIDKAKFKINGVDRPETSGKKPGTNEYYDEYVIPAGTTSFTVNAKLHHVTLGWF